MHQRLEHRLRYPPSCGRVGIDRTDRARARRAAQREARTAAAPTSVAETLLGTAWQQQRRRSTP